MTLGGPLKTHHVWWVVGPTDTLHVSSMGKKQPKQKLEEERATLGHTPLTTLSK